MSNEEPVAVTTSRGFSGATKFSDFKKSAAIDNSQQPKANKGAKPASKERGLADYEDYRDVLEAHNTYKDEDERRVSVDDSEEEDEDEDNEERPSLKEKIVHLAHEVKNMTHEVKGFYESRVKNGHDEL